MSPARPPEGAHSLSEGQARSAKGAPVSGTPTEQETFWAGTFGDEYIARNQGAPLLASNLQFFARALRSAGALRSGIEFGANIGMNLRALALLYPGIALRGVEINAEAARQLGETIGAANVAHESVFDHVPGATADLALVKGVLIHLNPERLPLAYDKIVGATHRFVLVCEYYNPTPVAITYRGHADRLFKRDFAGEMLDRHPALQVVDYGFCWRRDPAFPQDDVTWFLLEKRT